MVNECLICGKIIDSSGCEECGKLVFKDDVNLIIRNNKVSAKIYVSDKKILINQIDKDSIHLSFIQLMLIHFGAIGHLLSSYFHTQDAQELIIDFTSVKNHKITDENHIAIKLKKTLKLHIENEKNRQTLINLLNKYNS